MASTAAALPAGNPPTRMASRLAPPGRRDAFVSLIPQMGRENDGINRSTAARAVTMLTNA